MTELPILFFPTAKAWKAWLRRNHGTSPGVWLRIAKKSAPDVSVTHPEALDAALCHGWIDGQRKSEAEHTWLQKFLPRAKKSIWSKVNPEKALALIAIGAMQPAGLAEMERAKADGHWDAAYDAQRTASTPDFEAALERSPKAKAFYATLNSQNRYAFDFCTQTAKKPETRAKRIEQFYRDVGEWREAASVTRAATA